ncbi:MAG: glycoside hydrolase family protein [Alphaproteobacteria bacterium]|nr:glycoside hydrolase family protein [Alphaproteobacteria bacterium]
MSAAIFFGSVADIGMKPTQDAEGTVLHPYYDSVGVLTWCTGETQVGYQESFTEKECNALFSARYNQYASRLFSCYTEEGKRHVTPKMHAAFTDVYYNTGAKCKTSMVRNVNAGKPEAACDAILLYKYAGGKDCSHPDNRTCRGVWKRRLQFHELCMEGLPK